MWSPIRLFSYLKDADPPYYRSHRLGERATGCVIVKLLPFRATVLPILLTGNRGGFGCRVHPRVVQYRRTKTKSKCNVFDFDVGRFDFGSKDTLLLNNRRQTDTQKRAALHHHDDGRLNEMRSYDSTRAAL